MKSSSRAPALSPSLVSSIWASGKSLLNVISLLVVTPVVAFYMLYDWDNMVAKIDGWLPRKHQPVIRQIFADIDTAVAGFIRGQGSLCLVLGLFYGVVPDNCRIEFWPV